MSKASADTSAVCRCCGKSLRLGASTYHGVPLHAVKSGTGWTVCPVWLGGRA